MTERHILVSMPILDTVEPDTMMYVAALARRTDVSIAPVKGAPVDHVRNRIGRIVLDNATFTHVFMFDSDVIPPPDALDRLLEVDAPIVSGITPVCAEDMIVGNVMLMDENGKERHFIMNWDRRAEPFDVSVAGTGCILVRREVFEQVPWPWFRFEEHYPEGRVGEDMYFCAKARQYGFAIKAHPNVICDHYKKFSLLKIVQAVHLARTLGRKDRNADGQAETGLEGPGDGAPVSARGDGDRTGRTGVAFGCDRSHTTGSDETRDAAG